MTPCPRCHRHLRDHETACPFCAAPLPGSMSSTALKIAAVILTPLVLAACYGPPRGEPLMPEGGPSPPPAPSGKASPDAGMP
jgi:hypothetical protein